MFLCGLITRPTKPKTLAHRPALPPIFTGAAAIPSSPTRQTRAARRTGSLQRLMRLAAAAICQKWCALALDGDIGQILKLCETIAHDELLWNEAIEFGTGSNYFPDI